MNNLEGLIKAKKWLEKKGYNLSDPIKPLKVVELLNEYATDLKVIHQVENKEDPIREIAIELCNQILPKWEKHCKVCSSINCKSNASCIQCGCQF